MRLTRRSLLSVVATTPILLPAAVRAEDNALMGERSFGQPDAKVTVEEYFSLTCSHCAHFQQTTFPQVKTELIDKGIVRIVYRDFPLDQIALSAAVVARALPAARYEPFITALFASQDRWAFARNVNNIEEIWKFAALAGLSRASFDKAVADEATKKAILAAQDAAAKNPGVNSTPTFVIKGVAHAGALPYDRFNQLVTAALG